MLRCRNSRLPMGCEKIAQAEARHRQQHSTVQRVPAQGNFLDEPSGRVDLDDAAILSIKANRVTIRERLYFRHEHSTSIAGGGLGQKPLEVWIEPPHRAAFADFGWHFAHPNSLPLGFPVRAAEVAKPPAVDEKQGWSTPLAAKCDQVSLGPIYFPPFPPCQFAFLPRLHIAGADGDLGRSLAGDPG